MFMRLPLIEYKNTDAIFHLKTKKLILLETKHDNLATPKINGCQISKYNVYIKKIIINYVICLY